MTPGVFHQKGRYLSSEVDLEQVYAFGWVSGTDLARYYSGADEDLSAWTIDNQLQARFETGTVEHTLLFGLDHQQRENDVVWESGTATTLDVTNPQRGGPISITSTQCKKRDLQQTGLYAQDQMRIDRWHLMAGLRNDWVDTANTDRDTGSTSEYADTQISGRAGVPYRLDNGAAPYMSYSTSFSPNSTTDMNGDLLDPTEGEQVEAGVKFQPVGTRDRYTAAVFHITQENVSTKDPNESFYRAIGEIRSQGLELDAESWLGDNLRIEAAYTYTDVVYAETADSTQGNTANQVPEHQANVWSSYTVDEGTFAGMDFGLGVRHYADIHADEENTGKVPDYTLVDATIGYDLSHIGVKGLSARLNVNNLTDEGYIASCYDLNYCYAGEERNIRATLNYRF